MPPDTFVLRTGPGAPARPLHIAAMLAYLAQMDAIAAEEGLSADSEIRRSFATVYKFTAAMSAGLLDRLGAGLAPLATEPPDPRRGLRAVTPE